MSERINVVIGDNFYAIVEKMAKSERRSLSQMAAILIEEALRARNLYPKSEESDGEKK